MKLLPRLTGHRSLHGLPFWTGILRWKNPQEHYMPVNPLEQLSLVEVVMEAVVAEAFVRSSVEIDDLNQASAADKAFARSSIEIGDLNHASVADKVFVRSFIEIGAFASEKLVAREFGAVFAREFGSGSDGPPAIYPFLTLPKLALVLISEKKEKCSHLKGNKRGNSILAYLFYKSDIKTILNQEPKLCKTSYFPGYFSAHIFSFAIRGAMSCFRSLGKAGHLDLLQSTFR
ncbi:uncharacterized protein LOC131020561 isoform X1 [Salvia miltiorrhiza]|uniref:uncharacterized protein LOC131020561 isoform X1 n=1 Tax=Salvia miltiorrhiza TaxID=226208 RepID=UPI0025ACE7E6|nr:uncharacterized protein LOC131020561 isoform X1 [Salvia miltiorrhiza]XP_057805445.1 uncharacterized protein LOC131020561 isoform X1 [Salvia miltiorrhiza]XP_057805446.1 uncharacterized protein LOC131020561 isoform X1 [Salvia miltiorrhiza]